MDLFVNQQYRWLASRFGILVKAMFVILLLLGCYFSIHVYSSLNSLMSARELESGLAAKSAIYLKDKAENDDEAEDIQRFNREVQRLKSILPETVINPVALLNLIEESLPVNSRLQYFDFDRNNGEVSLKVLSLNKASIQSFVTTLEKTKRFKAVLLQTDIHSKDGYVHTVVIKI